MAASADLSSGIVCSFCFYDCLLFRLKPVSTSWCFGARAGALWIFEQYKTKWKRHIEHCLWYGSFGRPKFGHCLLFFEQFKTKWQKIFRTLSLIWQLRQTQVRALFFFVFVFMIVFSLGQSLQARAGALEHELVLCEFLSNLKPSEKDI